MRLNFRLLYNVIQSFIKLADVMKIFFMVKFDVRVAKKQILL